MATISMSHHRYGLDNYLSSHQHHISSGHHSYSSRHHHHHNPDHRQSHHSNTSRSGGHQQYVDLPREHRNHHYHGQAIYSLSSSTNPRASSSQWSSTNNTVPSGWNTQSYMLDAYQWSQINTSYGRPLMPPPHSSQRNQQQTYTHQRDQACVRPQTSSTEVCRPNNISVIIHATYTPQPQSQQQEINVHDVKMTALPFLDVAATPLVDLIKPSGSSGTSHTFLIEESLLKHFRDKTTANPYKVYVRFCRDDTSSEQKDFFAPNLQIKVNGVLRLLPGWNQIPRAPATPIEITSLCDFETNRNTIDVVTNLRLVMFVHVMKKQTHEDLLQKLLAKDPIAPSATVARIKEKLQEDGGNGTDITLTSLQFSLMCPVSKVKMRLPCRASTCQHLQCFDAVNYLMMNEKKPKWICPVCSDVIEYRNLQIDEHFKNVLENNTSSEKVLLQADGSCKPWEATSTDESILTLDDSVDTLTRPVNEELQSANTHCVTIDLLSDEDDPASCSQEVGELSKLSAFDKDQLSDFEPEVLYRSEGSCESPAFIPLSSQRQFQHSPKEVSTTPRSIRARKQKWRKLLKNRKAKAVATSTPVKGQPRSHRMILRSHRDKKRKSACESDKVNGLEQMNVHWGVNKWS